MLGAFKGVSKKEIADTYINDVRVGRQLAAGSQNAQAGRLSYCTTFYSPGCGRHVRFVASLGKTSWSIRDVRSLHFYISKLASLSECD